MINKKLFGFLFVAFLLVGLVNFGFGEGEAPTGEDKIDYTKVGNVENALKLDGNQVVILGSDAKAPIAKDTDPKDGLVSLKSFKNEEGIITASFNNGNNVSFNLTQVDNYCKESVKQTPCANLTKEGLKFANGAIFENGKITSSKPGELTLEKIGNAPAKANLSGVKKGDFESLNKFHIKGKNSVVIDHLGNIYTDTDFELDKVGDTGALKITATTPVTMDYEGNRVGTLETGTMTMHPDGIGKTAYRTSDTEKTTYIPQIKNGSAFDNLFNYTGKGVFVSKGGNLNGLAENNQNPVFNFSGGNEGDRGYILKVDPKGGDVRIKAVNAGYVTNFSVGGVGNVSWSFVKDGAMPPGFEGTNQNEDQFKVVGDKDSLKFFVNPRGEATAVEVSAGGDGVELAVADASAEPAAPIQNDKLVNELGLVKDFNGVLTRQGYTGTYELRADGSVFYSGGTGPSSQNKLLPQILPKGADVNTGWVRAGSVEGSRGLLLILR